LCSGINQQRVSCGGLNSCSIHAEHDCIVKFGRRKPRRTQGRLTALIFRFKKTKDGKIHYYNSYPCVQCKNMLNACGFKKVFATDDDGNIKRLNMRTLEDQSSFLIKNLRRDDPLYLNMMYWPNKRRQKRKIAKRLGYIL
jgi:deoxycytidylate deaminase